MISNRNACGQNLSQVAGEEFVPLRLLLSIEQLAAMQIMGTHPLLANQNGF